MEKVDIIEYTPLEASCEFSVRSVDMLQAVSADVTLARVEVELDTNLLLKI